MSLNRSSLVTGLEYRLYRPFMLKFLYERLGLIMLSEHPKSGGTWVSQILSDYLGVAYPRNELPSFEPSLMHGHYLHASKYSNAFFVVRDGRDVLVSWYYHCYFDHGHNKRLSSRIKEALPFNDYSDVTENLPAFIRFHFENKKPLGIDWVSFNQSWLNHTQYVISYERMLEDPVLEVEKALRATLGINEVDLLRLKEITDKYAFSKQVEKKDAGKTKGRFLRKGVAGDWKNVFSREASEVFDYYAGDMLIKLGYEANHEWVDKTHEKHEGLLD